MQLAYWTSILRLAALSLAIASAAFDLFLAGLFSGRAFLSPLVELSSSSVNPSSAADSNSSTSSPHFSCSCSAPSEVSAELK